MCRLVLSMKEGLCNFVELTMKLIAAISQPLVIALVLLAAGCEPVTLHDPLPSADNASGLSICVSYAPSKIDILPLTELKAAHSGAVPELIVYVSLLDSFGSQIKSPGKLRFELYEQRQRSAEPKGRRVEIWPDIDFSDPNVGNGHWFDLSEPAENNRKWRDFIRAYEFALPLKTAAENSYILEATCLIPSGRRLTAQVSLKTTK